MSSIEALDELREWIESLHMPLNASFKNSALGVCDAIEREIAERYMVLPVDAEGVPIRIGDLLVRGDDDKHVCHGIGESSLNVMDEHLNWWRSGAFRHVKQRSLEDVLADVRDGNLDTGDAAAEIRGLMS